MTTTNDTRTRCGSPDKDLAYIDHWLYRIRVEIQRRYQRNPMLGLAYFDGLLLAAGLEDQDRLYETIRTQT